MLCNRTLPNHLNACVYNNYVLNRAEQGKKRILLQSMAMTSIVSKKKVAGKYSKRFITLEEKIKILDMVKKGKMSFRDRRVWNWKNACS